MIHRSRYTFSSMFFPEKIYLLLVFSIAENSLFLLIFEDSSWCVALSELSSSDFS